LFAASEKEKRKNDTIKKTPEDGKVPLSVSKLAAKKVLGGRKMFGGEYGDAKPKKYAVTKDCSSRAAQKKARKTGL